MTFFSFCRSGNFITKFTHFYTFTFLYRSNILMSVGWDVKWCPVSRIITPLARKRPFRWISMKSRLVRAVRETSKCQNWSHFTSSRHRNMGKILPIRRKTLSNQFINQSINQSIVRICLLSRTGKKVPLIQSSCQWRRTLTRSLWNLKIWKHLICKQSPK